MNDNQNIYATPAGSNAVNNNNNNNDIINITNNGVSPSPRTPQSTNMNSFSNSNFPFPTPPPNLGQRTYDFDGKPEEWKKYQPNGKGVLLRRRLTDGFHEVELNNWKGILYIKTLSIDLP